MHAHCVHMLRKCSHWQLLDQVQESEESDFKFNLMVQWSLQLQLLEQQAAFGSCCPLTTSTAAASESPPPPPGTMAVLQQQTIVLLLV